MLDGLIQLLERANFDLNDLLAAAVLVSAFQGGHNASCQRDVIVLDENSIRQIQPMVLSASTTHRILVEHSQSRNGLAGVQNSCLGTRYRIHETARQRGDPTQPLQEIQNHAFTRENHPSVVADHGHRLSVVQAYAIEDFCMRCDLVMRRYRAVQSGIHVENARHAANARENTILLGENRCRGTLVCVNARIAGSVARGTILQQCVLDDSGNASAIPIHKLVVGHWSFVVGQARVGTAALDCTVEPKLDYPSSSSLLFAFSRRISSSCARLRIPSTTFAGAFARNCSLPSCRWPLAYSFSTCSSSFFNRSRSAAISIFRS